MTIRPISDTEFSLDANGWSFLICLGSYTNGNYIAFPERSICIKAGSWGNVGYNEERLSVCRDEVIKGNAFEIAEAARAYMSGEY